MEATGSSTTTVKPSFFTRVGNFVTGLYHAAKSSYYVEVATIDENKNVTGKKYVKYDGNSGDHDFVDSTKDATVFDALLGYAIVKGLRKQLTDMKNIDIRLVTTADAQFIDDIFNAPSATPAKHNNMTGFDLTDEIHITQKGIDSISHHAHKGLTHLPEATFLISLADKQWHSIDEMKQRGIKDISGIIAEAKRRELIQTR